MLVLWLHQTSLIYVLAFYALLVSNLTLATLMNLESLIECWSCGLHQTSLIYVLAFYALHRFNHHIPPPISGCHLGSIWSSNTSTRPPLTDIFVRDPQARLVSSHNITHPNRVGAFSQAIATSYKSKKAGPKYPHYAAPHILPIARTDACNL